MPLAPVSGPGLAAPPPAGAIDIWAFVALGCAGVLLVESLVISYLLRDSGTPFWRRVAFLVPAGLSALLLLLAQRAWIAAGGRITVTGDELGPYRPYPLWTPVDTFATLGL